MVHFGVLSKSNQYWLVALIFLTAGTLLVLAWKDRIPKPEAIGRRNVYLLTVGGLRADRLGIYDYQPIQTPGIDYLAGDGVLFMKAFTPSTNSTSAHRALLTGRYPFGAEKGSEESLPKRLQTLGYKSAAIVTDPGLNELKAFFEEYLAVDTDPAQSALQWIRNNRSIPHLVLINFSEPAAPYAPPPPFDKHYEKHPLDGETAAVDGRIAAFIHQLKKEGHFARSIVVLTSAFPAPLDETERTVADPQLQVPLIIAAEGLLPRQSAYQNAASLIDIFPTIVSLLEIPLPENLNGQPLFFKGSDAQLQRAELSMEFIRADGTVEYFRRKESGEYFPFSPD